MGLSNILKHEWAPCCSALSLYCGERFPAFDVKFISLVWHNSTQADYIGHREHICVRQVTRDCSVKTACTLVHCVVRECAHILGERWTECNCLAPMNVNRSIIDSHESKQRLYVRLLFDCISLQIQWSALLNSLTKALCPIGQQTQPEASWDCQLMANNHANNNNTLFHHGKRKNKHWRQSELDLFIMVLLYKLSKKTLCFKAGLQTCWKGYNHTGSRH